MQFYKSDNSLHVLFYFVIIVYSCAVVINNKGSHVPFTQLPPMVTSCETQVQCHNQDIDIDTKHLHHRKDLPCLSFIATLTFLLPVSSLTSAITNLFSISIILSFQKY